MDRFCCDNKCHQGRYCPNHLPAEACTEIGNEEDIEQAEDMALAIVLIVAAVAAACGLWSLFR